MDGENCVIDLNPLSSPKQSEWHRLAESGLNWLRTREECEAHLAPLRCDLLRKRLDRYKPSRVLFYGLSHQRWWERISAHRFSPSKVDQLWLADGENTLFAMMPHPVNLNTRLPSKGEGAVKRFLADVGAALREEIRRL